MLFENNLCIAKGVYKNGNLIRAIVYIVPGEVISSAIGDRNRYVLVTDKNGWVYASNTRGLRDDFGQIEDILYARVGYVRNANIVYYSYMTELEGRNLKI